jgi:hypothetical protein
MLAATHSTKRSCRSKHGLAAQRARAHAAECERRPRPCKGRSAGERSAAVCRLYPRANRCRRRRPDALNSSTRRIWCRTADNAALARRVVGSNVTGKAEFVVPAFDKPVDPGPPTADLLEVAARLMLLRRRRRPGPTRRGSSDRSPSSSKPTITSPSPAATATTITYGSRRAGIPTAIGSPTSTSIESVTRCTGLSRAIICTLAVALSRNASRSISPRRRACR